jgi:hypothetical protein
MLYNLNHKFPGTWYTVSEEYFNEKSTDTDGGG